MSEFVFKYISRVDAKNEKARAKLQPIRANPFCAKPKPPEM